MISAHLPAGTKIVCIVDRILPHFTGFQPKFMHEYTLDGYIEEREYIFGRPIGHMKIWCYLAEEQAGNITGHRFNYPLDVFDVVQKLPEEVENRIKETV